MRRLLMPVLLLGAFLVPALVPAPAAAAGTLTVKIVGRGTVTGSGIDCSDSGGTCSTSAGQASLSGTPAEGYTGPTWQGCDFVFPVLNQCWVNAEGGRTVTATFADVQAPVIRSVSPPTGSTVAGTVDVTADVADNSGSVSRVRFFVNGTRLGNDDTQAPFSAEVFTPAYGDREITVEVEAFDAADNSSGRTAVTYDVDNTPPETEFVKVPPKRMVVRKKQGIASFVFASSEENSTFECSVDNYAWEECSRKQDYSLPLGKHVIRVSAIDAAGSPDLSPAVYKWKIIRKPRR